MVDESLIEQHGWRQWSFVGTADFEAVRAQACCVSDTDPPDGARLLVVTQDCDLVHHSYASEPSVDAYLCVPLAANESVDGNLTAAKNPRSLLLPAAVSTEVQWFRVQASGRVVFPRQLLESLTPDLSICLTEESIAILQRWCQIVSAFERADGIDSCDFRVLDEGDFPISLLRTHQLFPLDFLSLGDKPGGELPPVG